ncbi:hypothetical protein GC175_29305 [bacterium]|nr:hypothetical protein [bacterium]
MSKFWASVGLFVLLGMTGIVAAFSVIGGASPIFARQAAAMPEDVLPLPADFTQRWWAERRAAFTQTEISPRRVSAQTLYVDINAASDGDGSQAHPYRSLATAAWEATVTGAYDAIAVAPGEYRTDVGIPSGVRLYAQESYTNTFIVGKLSLAAQTRLENFTVQVIETMHAGGDEIVVVGNYFEPATENAVVNLSTHNGLVALNLFNLPVTLNGSAAVIDNGFGKGGLVAYGGAGDNLFEGNLMLGEWTLRESDELDAPKVVLANNWIINAVLHLEPYQGGRRIITAINNHFLNAQVHESLYVLADKLVMENNIFAYTQAALYFSTGVTPTLRNNLFFSNGINLWPADNPVGVNGNIEADPLFVNLEGGNFRLSAASPAIDVGGSVPLVRDYKGDPRPCDGNNDGTAAFDIGGDEYSAAGGCIVTTPTPLPTRMPTPTKFPTRDGSFPTDTPTSSIPTDTPPPTWTPTVTPTATSTPTATAAGCRQLLSETSFEFDQAWTFIGDANNDAVRTTGWGATTGFWSALISHSQIGAPAYVQQPVRLPAGQLTLDFRFRRFVQEGIDTHTPHRVELVNPQNGDVVAVLWETPPSSTYWQSVQVSFTWPQEQDLLLRIGGIGAFNSYVTTVIDDVLLTHCATGGQPTVTSTATTTPLVAATATPTPQRPGCTQLLTNPGYDEGMLGWSFVRDNGHDFVGRETLFPAYDPQNPFGVRMSFTTISPPGSALFVEQPLRLPTGEFVFDLHWQRRLSEPKGDAPMVRAELVDPQTGEVLEVLWTAPNRESNLYIWETAQVTFTWPTEKDVLLRIGGRSIAGDTPLHIMLDDIRLSLCADSGQSTVTPTPYYTPTDMPPFTPTPTATPENSSPGCQQLLVNAHFWPSEGGWTQVGDANMQSSLSSVSEPTIGVVPLRPEQNGLASALAQTVVIPPGRVNLFVNTKIETERLAEPLQSFQIQVRSSDGQQVLSTLAMLDTAHNWQLHSFDLSAFVGQQVQIWLGGVPVSNAEPTRLNVDDVFLFSCRTDVQSGGQLYLPSISAIVPSPTPTPTLTPTSTPPVSDPLPAPTNLARGVLDSGYDTNEMWYRTSNGKLMSNGAAEPFPLDESIKVRGVAASDAGLLAATDQGVYRREKTFRWQRISEMSARHIGHYFSITWITPDAHPDQIWESVSSGAWRDVSAGLSDEVVSAVEGTSFTQYVLTLRQGYYILWRRTLDQPTWAEVAVVPGAAIAYTADGIPGSLTYQFDMPRVGSSDGKLYDLRMDENGTRWEMVHDFGAGVFPLQLSRTEISAIDLESGEIQLYNWQGGLEGEWVRSALRDAALPAGATGFRQVFGVNTPLQVGFAGMGIGGDGALYRYDMELENEEAIWRWRPVTATPQRSDFIIAQLDIHQVGPLYSGARLQWTGSECSATASGFYRSQDKGITWTEVVIDTARQPVTSFFGKPDFVIAATCSGPSVSVDGGETWRNPAQLGWPLPVGAQHLAFYTEQNDYILYAAGVSLEGNGFLLRASLDPETGNVGTWTTIPPTGMQAPEVFAVFNGAAAEEMVPAIYLVDAATVWLSADDGVTWQQRNDNLNGAQVRAFYPYFNDTTETTGVLVATDKGLFLGPVAGETGPWIATGYAYTTQPVSFAAFFPWAVYLNGEDGVFQLPHAFFTYIAP